MSQWQNPEEPRRVIRAMAPNLEPPLIPPPMPVAPIEPESPAFPVPVPDRNAMTRLRSYIVDIACLVPLTILGQLALLDKPVDDWRTWAFSLGVAVGRTLIPQLLELLIYIRQQWGTSAGSQV